MVSFIKNGMRQCSRRIPLKANDELRAYRLEQREIAAKWCKRAACRRVGKGAAVGSQQINALVRVCHSHLPIVRAPNALVEIAERGRDGARLATERHREPSVRRSRANGAQDMRCAASNRFSLAESQCLAVHAQGLSRFKQSLPLYCIGIERQAERLPVAIGNQAARIAQLPRAHGKGEGDKERSTIGEFKGMQQPRLAVFGACHGKPPRLRHALGIFAAHIDEQVRFHGCMAKGCCAFWQADARKVEARHAAKVFGCQFVGRQRLRDFQIPRPPRACQSIVARRRAARTLCAAIACLQRGTKAKEQEKRAILP